jgi:hypothetical protein
VTFEGLMYSGWMDEEVDANFVGIEALRPEGVNG